APGGTRLQPAGQVGWRADPRHRRSGEGRRPEAAGVGELSEAAARVVDSRRPSTYRRHSGPGRRPESDCVAGQPMRTPEAARRARPRMTRVNRFEPRHGPRYRFRVLPAITAGSPGMTTFR